MKLIPPDKKRCQAEHQIGAFQFGGEIGKRVRCSNPPIAIVTERRKAKDGMKGSMSLCADCLEKAEMTFGLKYFTTAHFKPQKPSPPGRRRRRSHEQIRQS